MIDAAIRSRLESAGVSFCTIGATALAVHGVARYTVDVDLLTLAPEVLEPNFWSGLEHAPTIRRGDVSDPLRGVVRWSGPAPVDLIVGWGYAARYAVETAVPSAVLGLPVATPLALVLLKLQAGGHIDRHDILALIDAQRALNLATWEQDLPEHVAHLDEDAQALWSKLSKELPAVT